MSTGGIDREDKSLVKLVSTSFVGGIASRGLMFLLHLVIARNLGADGLGVFALALVIMHGGSLLAKLGLDNAAQKYTPIYVRQEEQSRLGGVILFGLGGSFLFGTIVSAVVYGGLVMATRYNLWTIQRPISLALLGIPVMAFMTIGMSATTGFMETKYRMFVDIGQKGSAVLMTLFVVYWSGNTELVVLVYILSLAIGGLLALTYLYRLGAFEFTGFPTVEAKKYLTYSLPLLFSSVTMYLTSWTDILMLGVFEPATVVGQYQAASQTTKLLSFLMFAVNSIFPSIAADLYQHDRQRLNDIFVPVTKWITYFTLFGFLFFVFFAEEILLIFGREFTRGRAALLVLGAATVLTTSVGPVGYLLSMSEYERLELVNTASASVVNIVLNFVLIQRFGLLGAAVATAVSMTMLNLIRVFETWRLIGIRPVVMDYWKGAIAMTGAVVVMYVGSRYTGSPWVTLGITGVIATAIFLGTIVTLGLNQRDRLLFETLF